jgi:hypothetical protein
VNDGITCGLLEVAEADVQTGVRLKVRDYGQNDSQKR